MSEREPGSTGRSAKKSTGGSASKSGAAKKAAGAAGTRTTTGRTTTTKRTTAGNARPAKKAAPAAGAGRGGSRPPTRKPGKSIVNQKQTPWGLIAAAVAVVLFAAAIVIVVVVTHKSSSSKPSANLSTTVSNGGQAVSAKDPWRQPALKAALAIQGVTYKVEGNHNHVTSLVQYDATPPIGGDHNQYWANCTGTVYDHQIANENAVHMLEHGAIWITYNPKEISGSKLATLKKYVAGVDRTALSPYAGLKTPISLQAWGYQLFLSNPSDPRIAQFIKVLRYNKATTPEYGASCSDPYFKASQSYPGHPFEGPSS